MIKPTYNAPGERILPCAMNPGGIHVYDAMKHRGDGKP